MWCRSQILLAVVVVVLVMVAMVAVLQSSKTLFTKILNIRI